jgi:hypothetical protein
MASFGPPAVVARLEERYGGAFRFVESIINVLTAPTVIVGDNFERVHLTIINVSGANSAMIAPSALVSATRGFRISTNGGMLSVNVEQDAILPALGWMGFGLGGNPDVYVLQIIRDYAVAKRS